RPLFTAAHFRRFLGQRAKVTLRLPQQGRRRLQGVIAQAVGETISITTEQGDIDLALGNIERARLAPDWSALGLAPKPKPGRGGKANSKHKSNPNMKPTAPPPSSGANE
ncbi:MAG TPA: ribosome maturation factor RimP, partial [Xanthomonadaceae bacterium]|nr:ribosome maturation factor RimP [Xanthomonadaceae bacterium]